MKKIPKGEIRVLFNTITGKHETVAKGEDGMFHDCDVTFSSACERLMEFATSVRNAIDGCAPDVAENTAAGIRDLVTLVKHAHNREIEDIEATKDALSNVIAEKKQFAEIASKLKREISELNLEINAEKARRTKTYKDEMIRMQGEEIKTLKKEMSELRECLNEALEVACDGCRYAKWENKKFVRCKRHKNWKCPIGTDRWRKALER